MEKLIIQIGASSDHFGAFALNCDGIYGAGDTIEECKQNLLKGLKLFISTTKNLPEILKGEYEIEYHFDVQSILKYYADVFTKPALERLTGINQKQLHHYATGLKKPRPEQRKKIETALHKLGSELLTIQFS
jgi:predicted RNase H-like HicB family nuclease